MEKVISKDGTAIAFDRTGAGPPVILVSGALSVRSHPVVHQWATLLGEHFTVFTYDRRGRGDSTDTAPYAVAREIEDLGALIDEAGGAAFVYGMSSGGVLALEATAAFPAKVKKLAMYEPPFAVEPRQPPLPENYTQHLDELVATGRRGDAVAYFFTEAVGIPAEVVGYMRRDPSWAGMEAVAHTLPYDNAVLGDNAAGKPFPPGQWATATVPALVITGGASPPDVHTAARALASILPNATHRVLEGQTHSVAPEALAPVLIEFFAGQ